MPSTKSADRRKRHLILGLIAAGAVAVAVALVVTIVVVVIRRPESPVTPPPDGVITTTPTTPGKKPRPEFQSADCPDTQLIVIPGTWESSRDEDPFNPGKFPLALLLPTTQALAGSFDASRAQVYTIPYTAQFHNPFAADKQMSYNDSRSEGTRATVQVMKDMNEKCPLTSYVLIGFSQGAVIAGDIASDVGNGRGPVDEDLVLGVTVIADGRRMDGEGNHIGPNPTGQGAEITLAEVPLLDSLGLKMTGPRDGGFGVLNDRVNTICAEGDLICDAPTGAFNIANLPATLDTLAGGAGQPVHAMYATPQYWVLDGQTATQWTEAWARNVLENAPHPPHG